MDYYGHKLFNGVLFAHHLILDVPGGSPHLGYRRRVRLSHNPPTRVKAVSNTAVCGMLGHGGGCRSRGLQLATLSQAAQPPRVSYIEGQ